MVKTKKKKLTKKQEEKKAFKKWVIKEARAKMNRTSKIFW